MSATDSEQTLKLILLYQGGMLTTAPAGPVVMYALGEPTYKLAFFAGFAACAVVMWIGVGLIWLSGNPIGGGDSA